MNPNKPKCPECDRYGKVYKTSLMSNSWACRRCEIWFVMPITAVKTNKNKPEESVNDQ